MKLDKNIMGRLAFIADAANTVNGGMVQTASTTFKNYDHCQVDIAVPGISPEKLVVEVNNDVVLVFLEMNISLDEQFSHIIKFFPIPNEVNSDLIQASYDERKLSIIMPYKELMDNDHRRLDIGL